jgi:hypothetical protein
MKVPISPNFSSISAVKNGRLILHNVSPNGSKIYRFMYYFTAYSGCTPVDGSELAFQICRSLIAMALSRMRVEITALPKWRDGYGKTWINTLENSFCGAFRNVCKWFKKIIGCETFWVAF